MNFIIQYCTEYVKNEYQMEVTTKDLARKRGISLCSRLLCYTVYEKY